MEITWNVWTTTSEKIRIQDITKIRFIDRLQQINNTENVAITFLQLILLKKEIWIFHLLLSYSI